LYHRQLYLDQMLKYYKLNTDNMQSNSDVEAKVLLELTNIPLHRLIANTKS
jgi:hypothetical protein